VLRDWPIRATCRAVSILIFSLLWLVVVPFVISPSGTLGAAAIEKTRSTPSSSARIASNFTGRAPSELHAVVVKAREGVVDVPQSGGRLIYADRYSDFTNALAATTGNTLVINKAMAVSTGAVVTSTTKLRFERGGLLQKSGSGTITFQGGGLVDAKSRQPPFSGFAVGDITWIGTDYPKELSLELRVYRYVSGRAWRCSLDPIDVGSWFGKNKKNFDS